MKPYGTPLSPKFLILDVGHLSTWPCSPGTCARSWNLLFLPLICFPISSSSLWPSHSKPSAFPGILLSVFPSEIPSLQFRADLSDEGAVCRPAIQKCSVLSLVSFSARLFLELTIVSGTLISGVSLCVCNFPPFPTRF